MTTIAMSLEGVLADHLPTDTLLNYEATDSGRAVFNLLKPTARITLLSADPSEDRVKSWLIRERLTGYSLVYNRPPDAVEDSRQWRISKLVELMGIGHRFSYYVDTDPFTVAQAMDVGINGLLLGLPHTYPGQDKGPQEPTPWYDLVQRVDLQNTLRAKRAQEENERAYPPAP